VRTLGVSGFAWSHTRRQAVADQRDRAGLGRQREDRTPPFRRACDL